MKCDVDIRKDLYANVVLSGASIRCGSAVQFCLHSARSSRCGSPRASTTSPGPPSCTGSASDGFPLGSHPVQHNVSATGRVGWRRTGSVCLLQGSQPAKLHELAARRSTSIRFCCCLAREIKRLLCQPWDLISQESQRSYKKSKKKKKKKSTRVDTTA